MSRKCYVTGKKPVLQQADIARALTRISHEILESNRGTDDLVILGIPTRGVVLARRIAENIQRIEPAAIASPADNVGALDVTMYRDDLSRHPTRTPQPTSLPGPIDGKTVVLVDDVLFSGRTIRAALDAVSDLGRPRELPIRADFVGKNLPSAASERIYVRLADVDGDESVTIEDPNAEPNATQEADA